MLIALGRLGELLGAPGPVGELGLAKLVPFSCKIFGFIVSFNTNLNERTA